MMGRQTGDQSQLFYLFNLEGRIPAGHLLRWINPIVTRVLAELRERASPGRMADASSSSTRRAVCRQPRCSAMRAACADSS